MLPPILRFARRHRGPELNTEGNLLAIAITFPAVALFSRKREKYDRRPAGARPRRTRIIAKFVWMPKLALLSLFASGVEFYFFWIALRGDTRLPTGFYCGL